MFKRALCVCYWNCLGNVLIHKSARKLRGNNIMNVVRGHCKNLVGSNSLDLHIHAAMYNTYYTVCE